MKFWSKLGLAMLSQLLPFLNLSSRGWARMKPFSPLQEGWVGLSEGQSFCGLNSPGSGVQSIPEMAQGRAHRLAVSAPALPLSDPRGAAICTRGGFSALFLVAPGSEGR